MLDIPSGFANWKISISNGLGGASAMNSISMGTDMTSALDQAAVDRIANIFRDGLTSLFDNSWLVGPTHVNETVAGIDKAWDSAGTEAGIATTTQYASPAVAHVVSKQTGLAGRRHRGRVYLPGVPEGTVGEDGVLVGTRVNEVTTAFNALLFSLRADAAIDDVVLFHDVSTPGAVVPDPIVAMVCRNVVGTMRPRQRR